MDFNLDETQRKVADLAREVLSREPDPDTGWKALGRAGLITLAAPEKFGGAGLGVREAVLVLAEAGRCASAVPALEAIALGVLPVARCGTDAQQRELLGVVTDGGVLTAALHELSAPTPAKPRTTARRSPEGWLVSGTVIGVRSAASAYRVLVPATLDGAGLGVLLVDPTAPGVLLTPTLSSAGWGEHTLRLNEVRVAETGLLGDDQGGRVLTELYRLALVGACAVADGVLAGAVQLTADHLSTRRQFGRPLATFQAVAQQAADVYLAARTLHVATLAACWQLDSSDSGSGDVDDVNIAAFWLADQLLPALHTCQHLHGGIGVDVSYPLHRYYAWGRDLTRFVGGAEHRLEALACTSS